VKKVEKGNSHKRAVSDFVSNITRVRVQNSAEHIARNGVHSAVCSDKAQALKQEVQYMYHYTRETI